MSEYIIEPVVGEATKYVSCFVAVSKPNNPIEIRITIDSGIIKAIMREHHIIEELTIEKFNSIPFYALTRSLVIKRYLSLNNRLLTVNFTTLQYDECWELVSCLSLSLLGHFFFN